MSKNSLKDSLKIFFKKELKVKRSFNKKSKIYYYKNWDSLANFNLLLNIEKKYNIKFTSKEFTYLNSFTDIYTNVKKKIRKTL